MPDEMRYKPTDEVSVTRVVVDAHLRRLDLKPGEVLICTTPPDFSLEEQIHVRDVLVMHLGNAGIDNPVLVLGRGMDVFAVTLTDEHLDSIAEQVARRLPNRYGRAMWNE